MRSRSGVLAVFVLACAGSALAADPRPLQVTDLFTLKDVGDPRLSADGRWVAYTVTSIDEKKDRSDTDIYMIATAGGEPIRLTSGDKPERRPRFSPDGRWIAFTGLGGPVPDGERYVQVMRTDGSERRIVVATPGLRQAVPAWQPVTARTR